MTKRKYDIFTVAESVPNCLAASQGVETPSVEINEGSAYGNTYSADLPTPSQEIPAISAESLANRPQTHWPEAQLVGPSPVTTTGNGGTGAVANWGQPERRECVPADWVAADVALTNVDVASEEGVVPVNVEVSQEDAAEWFWTLLAQSGYERW